MNISTNIQSEHINRFPTFAIAFGGGGARGFAHINVIEALNELGIKPVAISGTSIGSIMGAAMASGISGKDLRKFSIESITSRRSLYARFWNTRSSNLWDILSKGPQAIQFNVDKLLRNVLPSSFPDNIEDLKIPFMAVATDFYKECDHVMRSGDLISALAASSCIPGVFSPVVRDKSVLIDGCTTNPVPFEYLKASADIVIGVDIIASTEALSPMKSVIESSYGASQIFQRNIINLKAEIHKPDLILKPNVSLFKTMDFMKSKEIIDATAYIKDETKRKVEMLVMKYQLERQIGAEQ